MTDRAPRPLEALADRVGAVAWISDALFGLEGAWAADMADPNAVEHLAVASRHHGWHVELVEALLPDSPALHARDRIAAPAGWADAIALAARAVGDVARLAVLYRALVPRLAGELAALAAHLTGPGDAAMARSIGFVARDVDRDLALGSALLAAALVDTDAVRAAAEAVTPLDLAFANH